MPANVIKNGHVTSVPSSQVSQSLMFTPQANATVLHFSDNFTMVMPGGATVSYRKGDSHIVAPEVALALYAAGAPLS